MTMTVAGRSRNPGRPRGPGLARQCMPWLYGMLMGVMVGYQILPRAGLTEMIVPSSMTSSSILTTTETTLPPESNRLAYDQSFGFFDDIRDTAWTNMYQHRARNATHRFHRKKPLRDWKEPAIFYLKNYEPTFTCPQVRRIGGLGDGPKWTCDPHRIPRSVAERQARKADNGVSAKCLVYSVGSAGRFQFEYGLYNEIGGLCEIHIFDPGDFRVPGMDQDNMFFHKWGLKSSYDDSYKPKVEGKFLSLQETLRVLGHENRVIDIFKIDCEGCEWFTYKDWMTATDIRQILVETHGLPAPVESKKWPRPMNATEYFDAFGENGYVLFSKEVNIHPKAHNQCVEWSYVKLHQDFLHGE